MILREQVSKDQLQFELKIEKATWKNKVKKRKENQGEIWEESSTTSTFTLKKFHEESNMVEEQPP